MAGLARIFYNSGVLQSVMSMQIARIKAQDSGYTTTVTDLAGISTGVIDTLLDNIADDTITAIYVACLTSSTGATAKLSYDQLAFLNQLLVTASKGVEITSGTAQSNSTKTNIILAAATASASDDTYNGKYIRTAGTTAVSRYISDYTGSSKIAVVANTGTAITTTETYSVFTPSTKVYIIGDAATNETSCRVAWRTLYPTKNFPAIVTLMGGYGTIATGLNGETDGVTTFRQAVEVTRTSGGGSHSTTTLADTSHFTADAYINKWVGIESATVGAGQVRLITDNTVSALTVFPAWTTPTGTVVYTICDTEAFCLAHKYLTLAIPTYLSAVDSDTLAIWRQMIDKYGQIGKASIRLEGDLELLKVYLQRGKAIFEAKCAGVVS